jgi:hypothetical protein
MTFQPGHVSHADPILPERHDYRDWVEWHRSPSEVPTGARVRHEYVQGGQVTDHRLFIHPDDVPTDPDAELVKRLARALAESAVCDGTTDCDLHIARGVIALVRDHDKADR